MARLYTIRKGTPVEVRRLGNSGPARQHVMQTTVRLPVVGSGWNGFYLEFQHHGYEISVRRDDLIRYVVPCGTRCLVGRLSNDEWLPHATTRVSEFDRPYLVRIGEMMFRERDWVMRVNAKFVKEVID